MQNQLIGEYEKLIVSGHMAWHNMYAPSVISSITTMLPTNLDWQWGSPQLTADSCVLKLGDPFLNYLFVLNGGGNTLFCTSKSGGLASLRPNDGLAYLLDRYGQQNFDAMKAALIQWDRDNREQEDSAHPFNDWGSIAVRDKDGVIVGLDHFD